MRSIVLAVVFGLMASTAVAQDWGKVAAISSTLGVNGSRLCVGEASRGDIGCPTYAPSLTTGGNLEVSGNVSATSFSGDGSGLTGIVGASADRIVSGTTSMLAVSNTGYISITQAGTNTGWFDPSRGLVTIGVSSTGPISGTQGFFSDNVIIGKTQNATIYSLVISGTASGGVPAIQFYNGVVNGKVGNINNQFTVGTTSAAPTYFTTSGTTRMFLDASGNVGIGTAAIAPSATLHVSGTVLIATSATSALTISGTGTVSSSDVITINSLGYAGLVLNGDISNSTGEPGGAYVRFLQDGATTIGSIGLTQSNNKDGFGSNATGAVINALIMQSNANAAPIQFAHAGVVRMTISGSTVGINTNAPTTALEVSGTVSATNFVGDGSGLTGIVGASADRIVSGTTSMLAVSNTGYISITQAGTNTGWFDPTLGLVTIGVSSTGGISGTTGYFTGDLNFLNSVKASGVAVITSAREFRSTNGSTSTAAYSFGSTDLDTGLYHPAADTIGFTTSNTEAMRIVSTGYVGIGTTQPSGTLSIYNSVSSAVVLTRSDAPSNRGGLEYSGSALVLKTYTNDGLSFHTNNATRMVITNVGQVGMATNYPSATLHVSGTVRVSSWTTIAANVTPTTALDVYGTVSATNFVGNGSGLTGVVATTDRIVSGSINMIAEQTSGTVRVSGTLALQNTGNEVCNSATWYSFRVNPATGYMQMCRP